MTSIDGPGSQFRWPDTAAIPFHFQLEFGSTPIAHATIDRALATGHQDLGDEVAGW